MSGLASGVLLSAALFGLLGLSLTKLGHEKTLTIVFILSIVLAILGLAPGDPYSF